MLEVRHCGQLMRCQITDLKSGGKRYDLTCGFCGQREQEIHTSTGKSVAWRNITVKERHERQHAALAEAQTVA